MKMSFKFILILSASTLMAGCSKCSQQPTTEAPVTEPQPAAEATAEPAVSEGSSATAPEGQGGALPDVDKMKDDLPEGE